MLPYYVLSVPIALEKRLSLLSSNEKIFYQCTPYYEQAITNSGYSKNLMYINKQKNNDRKKTEKEI